MITLCDSADLPEGSARGFDPYGTGRDTIFLVRRGAEVFGYVNECPHLQNARMAWRKDAYLNGEGSHIMCSAHGALFEIETGLCVLGPCLGKHLKPVALTIDGGQISTESTLVVGLKSRGGTAIVGRVPGRGVAG